MLHSGSSGRKEDWLSCRTRMPFTVAATGTTNSRSAARRIEVHAVLTGRDGDITSRTWTARTARFSTQTVKKPTSRRHKIPSPTSTSSSKRARRRCAPKDRRRIDRFRRSVDAHRGKNDAGNPRRDSAARRDGPSGHRSRRKALEILYKRPNRRDIEDWTDARAPHGPHLEAITAERGSLSTRPETRTSSPTSARADLAEARERSS